MIKDDDKAWNTVKLIRHSYLSKFNIQKCLGTLMAYNLINLNLLEISRELNIDENSINKVPITNISRSHIQTAGQMFTYLNYIKIKLALGYLKILSSLASKKHFRG